MSQEDFQRLEDAWNAKHRELYAATQRMGEAAKEVDRLEREVTELAKRMNVAVRGWA